MRKRANIRPSPFASVIALVYVCVCLASALFLFVTRRGQYFGLLFIAICVITTVAGVYYHIVNAFSDEAPPTEVLDYDEPAQAHPQISVSDQLQELEELKDRSLITQSEYQQKRSEIISRL